MRKRMSDDLMAAWEAALAAAERHVKMATQLQKDGLEMMMAAKNEEDVRKSRLRAKEGRQSLAMGVQMERSAYDTVLALQRNKPRVRR